MVGPAARAGERVPPAPGGPGGPDTAEALRASAAHVPAMPRRVLLLALAVLAAAAAGCLGGDSAADDPGQTPDPGAPGGDGAGEADGGSDEPTGYATPRWAPGLWWSYSYRLAGETGTVTFAVQAQSDQQYTLLANGTHHAAVEAVRDLAYVGPVRADDLAGLVDGEPVRFFEWPLRDGRTWRTTWNGVERVHQARAVDAQVLNRTVPGIEVTSTAGNRTLATYTYSPSVGWFTRLEVPGRNLTYRLRDAGFAYRRNLTTADATTAFQASSPTTKAGSFDVPAEADRVAAALAGGGARASYRLDLADPNGTRHEYGPQACTSCQVAVLGLLPAAPGRWTAEATLASDPPGNLTASVSVVDARPVRVAYE